jgi:hypothetical protein
MAPEQLKCQHGQPLDFRCDLFAFGATLYEAATGINPFEGSSPETTMFNIMNVEPPALSKHRTDLGRLTPIVTRCLCKDPLRRPSSTEDLVRALEQLGPATTLPLTPVPDRSWWEVHQLAMAAFYAGALTLLWAVHALARPLWASQALTLASLLTGVLLIGVRLLVRPAVQALHVTAHQAPLSPGGEDGRLGPQRHLRRDGGAHGLRGPARHGRAPVDHRGGQRADLHGGRARVGGRRVPPADLTVATG